MVIKPIKKKPSKSTINGFIRDKKTGEPLIGATISLQNKSVGTTTNNYGFYSLTIPNGSTLLEIEYLGYETKRLQLSINASQRLDHTLETGGLALTEVVVSVKSSTSELESVLGGKVSLDLRQLQTAPSIAGEPDVIKLLQMKPGVNTVGEGSSGMYVRGGNIDQNLILLDEAPIYNPTHLLGFFSIFHPDAIHHVDFYKGNFPVEYGGRLSSVLNMKMKEGNTSKVGLEGGIGLLTSRILIDGPIKKDKHAFMVAARRS